MQDILDLLDTNLPAGVEGQFQDLVIGAQKGSIKDLSILARVHSSLPDPLTGDIHFIFLNHLNSSEVPTKLQSHSASVEERRAFWSLWGLSQLDEVLSNTKSTDPHGKELVKAWPGIFKWSAYFYVFRVQGSGKSQVNAAASPWRCIVRDVLIGSWCALCRSGSTEKVMLKTRGVGDIAARLWIFEVDSVDITGVTPFCDSASTVTSLLNLIASDGDQAALKRLTSAAGGDIGLVAETACRRLKKVIKVYEFPTTDPVDAFITFMFVAQLCFSKPETREGFLNHGAISLCTKFLLWIASVVNEREHSTHDRRVFVLVLKRAFSFIWGSLETGIGLPWILEAINSGLLSAFVECSPLYDDLTDDEYTALASPITVTIPSYLAYFCVVRAMDTTFVQLEKTAQFLSLRKTRAWEAFAGLATMTSWRWALAGQFKQMEKEISSCHNPKCQKSDPRNKFRKCARCGLALYCSKECQTTHWKEFGHKKLCFEPSKAYNGLQGDGNITVRDWEFVQALNICETRYHLPCLRRMASTEHPGVPLDKLSIVIDFTAVPTEYHVILNKRVRDDSNSIVLGRDYCIPNAGAISGPHIVGVVPYSEITGPRVFSMPFEEGVWDLDHGLTMVDGSKAKVDPTGNKVIDWMSEAAEERAMLYYDI